MKQSKNYILEYYQGIKNGSIVVGQWIKLWYERLIHGFEKKEFYFNQKKADMAINFIENFCHHDQGELAPQLLKLELWQKAFISVVFGIVDAEDRRQFKEVVLQIGRKNGKTLLAAAIAEYFAYLEQDYGKRIYFAAPKLEQANLCYDAVYQSIAKEKDLASITKRRRTDTYIDATNTLLKPLAFSEKKSDGLNISLCINDEFAAWDGNSGMKFYEVLKSSLGARRQPLILNISTANYVEGGLYDEFKKRGTRVIMGYSVEKRFAPFFYEIDDEEKWNDINELKKANPNLGVSVSVDYMLDEIDSAEESLSKMAEFKTKYCNIKQNAANNWLSTSVINGCFSNEKIDLSKLRDCYGMIGIDLSETTDLTAAALIVEKEGIINAIVHFFLPSKKIPEAKARDGLPYDKYITQGLLTPSGENVVDYSDVEKWINSVLSAYGILPLKVGYDKAMAQYLVQNLMNSGLDCDDVRQGFNLSPVIKELEGLMKDKKINFGDNELMKVHLLDCALKRELDGNRVKVVKSRENAHVDGAHALLDAMTVRQKYFDLYSGLLANEGG